MEYTHHAFNTGQIPAEVSGVIMPFLPDLLELYGKDIVSLFLYGSATGEDYVPGKSDINLGVVLADINEEHLEKAVSFTSRWVRKCYAAPLFLTQQYMSSSGDAFPIEFLEMKRNHAVIYGDDPFRDFELDMRYLRLECEQQVKGNLLRLRQSFLETGMKKNLLRRLLVQSFTSVIPVLREALRLKMHELPSRKDEVIAAAAAQFSLNQHVWQEVLALKTMKKTPRDILGLFGQYHEELKTLAHRIDTLL